tara:strand:+ start:3950 stop:4531 length:582 start_codon:yes stop_codon:yes gene_type:complete
MAVTIDGDGTITGVSVGGLPDGIVDSDMLAADAVTAAKVGFKGFVSYAIICDQKADDVDGGTFTGGAWQTRDLNTEIGDPDGIVSISSNQFTLGAGTYLIEASAPAHDCNRHQTRIYNATDSSVVQYGMNELLGTNDTVSSASLVVGRVTITASKAFEIQHRCQSTKSSIGFGAASGFGGVEIYTIVRIYKEG